MITPYSMSFPSGVYMASTNPRLQVPLSDELLSRYKAVGKVFGVSATRVAADILGESIGVIEQAAVMIEKSRLDQQNSAAIVADGLMKIVVDTRQAVAYAQIDLEDAIAASKKKSKAKA
jgi:hypothetical protein